MFSRSLAIPRNPEDIEIIKSFLSKRGLEGRVDLLVIDFSGIEVEDYVVSFTPPPWISGIKWGRGEVVRVKYDGMSPPSRVIQEIVSKKSYDMVIVVSQTVGNLPSMNLASSLATTLKLPLLVIPG